MSKEPHARIHTASKVGPIIQALLTEIRMPVIKCLNNYTATTPPPPQKKKKGIAHSPKCCVLKQ